MFSSVIFYIIIIFIIIIIIIIIIITKWTLRLTQLHKTGSWNWGLHPLIYNERL